MNLTENMDIISRQFAQSRTASSIYNYYSSSQFGLTKDQILSVATGVGRDASTFNYSNEYSSSVEYQFYAKTASGYGNLKNYILNQILNAEYLRKISESNLTRFEFRFYWEDNGGSSILSNNIIQDVVVDASQLYNIPLELDVEPNGTSYKVDDTSSNSSIVLITLKAIN